LGKFPANLLDGRYHRRGNAAVEGLGECAVIDKWHKVITKLIVSANGVARQAMRTRVLRNPVTRYAALAVAVAILMVFALAPLASIIVDAWSRRDVELRSRFVFRSIHDQVATSLAAKPVIDLVPYFERVVEDDRVLALGFCNEAGQLQYATKLLPKSFSCASLARGKTDTITTVSTRGRKFLVSVFPLSAGLISGHVLVLQDLPYVDERTREAQFHTVLALVGIAVVLGLLSMAMLLALLQGWTKSILNAITDVRDGSDQRDHKHGYFPASREMHALLSEFRVERRITAGIHVEWSPETLRRLLLEELPGAQIMVVSNREPYIHNHVNNTVALQIPASGLVTALEPVMRACGGTWIAHGSGSADRETVDVNDRLGVPPADPTYTLRRVWLNEEELDGYYYGFANEGLWPLCHIAFVRPTFRERDWAQYVAVNQRFADVVIAESSHDDPIVLVQDYHFALLPRMIRKRLPKATIITFWHIPWPNSETFGICPWREKAIDGLLGSTILGFHTQFHCNNFLEAADRFMESRIDREHASITVGGHETMIRPYPISIEWPPAALATQAPIQACRDAVRQRYRLHADVRILVGIERFDYTKGILDRISAFDELLSGQPEWRGKLAFIQAAAPTRIKLGAYSALQVDAIRLVDEINHRHGNGSYQPIHLVVRHHEPNEVYELFRAADMCIVSSLHDGMNLVAKEFVASRDDEQGVLILSSFAGASRELSEALIVNPYDTRSMAEAMATALRMPASEQRDRMHLMRDLVRQRNVYRWAAQMLLDAARLRRHERILTIARH
jgi:trehalose 6-phosphate synthase